MGLFSKFGKGTSSQPLSQQYPGSPQSAMTEMTNFSDIASVSRSPATHSSGASMMSATTVSSAYSSRKYEKGWVQDINKHSLMAKHLYRNCKRNNWLEDKSPDAVVALRTFQGGYILYPPEDQDERFENAVRGLNVEVSNSSMIIVDE
jgi:hypothetical protein